MTTVLLTGLVCIHGRHRSILNEHLSFVLEMFQEGACTIVTVVLPFSTGWNCLHEIEPSKGWDIEALINSQALSVFVAVIVLISMRI